MRGNCRGFIFTRSKRAFSVETCFVSMKVLFLVETEDEERERRPP